MKRLAVTADMTVEGDMERIVAETLKRFGRIDILVNNAGIIHPRIDLVDFDMAMWREVIKVNLMGVALLTKATLISLTESVAAEVKQYGIDVNCICPGGVDTEGYREAFNIRGREDNPKLMMPEEIAELAVFLASEASSAVTGSAVDAFGGTNPLFQ